MLHNLAYLANASRERGAQSGNRRMIRRLVEDRRGASAIEYGLISSLVAVAAVAGFSSAGAGVDKALRYARVGMLPETCAPGSHRVVSLSDGIYCKANG